MSENSEHIANCRPGMNEKSKDFEKCSLQARADAIAAVTYCLLPLELKRPAGGWLGWVQDWYRNSREDTAAECTIAELRAKPNYYDVPPFTKTESQNIINRATEQATSQAQAGQRRLRKHDR